MNLKNIENKKTRFVGIYEKAINNKFNWDEKIKIAKAAGFDFIEFSVDESDERLSRLDWNDETINNLLRTLIDNNFYFNSMCLSAHRRFPFGSKNEETRKKSLEIMEKALILAKKLGIRIIQIAAYDVYYEKADSETRKNFLNGMKECAKLASKYSVTLAFETMDTPFAGTISKCLSFLKFIDMPNFYIYPDLGNLNQFTKDVDNEILLGKDKIVAFHFKDTLPTKFKEVEWGKGTVDFAHSLTQIKINNINVPILIEMWSKNKPDETVDQNITKIKQAKDFYDEQWKRANGE
ncbi:L-ribulose-5-phosphate 3-epimerase [Mycoplasmopsis cynos]|uniref:L-ribulose-5-phosphate 3-epimerase n=1 Tax=Mycoplasmopsis cynos TaxID=171284 RepID=A0A449AHT9_9BACT|nr:L-ribulose-5-phosphate 3-epimerase [Mycoplasmopsis cynos]TQC54764.1 L-ribulose-5-phosphate 3-epimerase [Mycoplasmopsis cynos]VEU64567.1 L-ribulose-5-phosphate 3-epimerase ulaE [Mycoplasmopsis cynos]